MTYNQIVTELRKIMQSHAMIKQVKFATPVEWLSRDEQPTYPIACYAINAGQLNKGREQVFNVQIWFLDKSGAEAEFETDVVSDQMQIAADIVSKLRIESNDWFVDNNINFDVISDKFEDYLAGVQLTFNIFTISNYDACDIPVAS